MPSHIPRDPALADHLAWLGYVQPEGLVVSAPALVDAQAIIDRAQLGELQQRFADHVISLQLPEGDAAETQPGVGNIYGFITDYLGWPSELLFGVDPSKPLPDSLCISLPEFQETLRPSFAVARPPSQIENRKSETVNSEWLLLAQSHPATVDLDKPAAASDRNWHASAAKKFERLMRETGVAIGLLTNGTQFRLIYAPPKENSGALTFPVGAMTEVSGRLILGAFQLLLGSWTLFTAPSEARLPALLQRSRDYQASVSEILAEQVLHALYELLRGFEAAEERVKGSRLRELAGKDPANIYGGLVTVLLRLVFTLFAEDRGLLPMSGLYVRHYSVRGLFERLRADAERHPDTMDHRFGAWAQLLALFRVIHGGCKHPDLKMPARAGHLFDPGNYPFLEGRALRSEPIGALPLVSDGTIHRVLEKLCILEGERVSYRTLDVEEIGSVYQTIMGFGVEAATGTAIGLKGKRKNGGVPASPVIYLEELLAVATKDRAKWLKENADTELTGEADKRLKAAASVDDLIIALEKRIDRHATPGPVAKGGLVLQPTDERRRSGSHYTPRSFTEPIVRKTLEPILKRLTDGAPVSDPASSPSPIKGDRTGARSGNVTVPAPGQILDLKICDIAVGSAAFLVETCRQLSDALVRAWRVHGERPALPPDETEELLAMRTVAQRCLYGVDRNPMATDLAKLSLWLATLAKDHPFTFLDHAIRCGDSLVGLTRRQIECFTWKTGFTTGQLWEQEVRKRSAAALRERHNLLGLGDDYGTPQLKREKLEKADELLDLVRFIGNAAVAAFLSADKDKVREAKRAELADRIGEYLRTMDMRVRPTDEVKALSGGQFPVTPFHWVIEYPEVFDRENPGFDAIVGNPPFLGGSKLSTVVGKRFMAWLATNFPESHGKSDLVAYFFRRAFDLIRTAGTCGLIATNTIRQGDTRQTGLRWIRKDGGWIYLADLRRRWPGIAAVVVSVVHLTKKIKTHEQPMLNSKPVTEITAYLFHFGPDESPSCLSVNRSLVHSGTNINGKGFVLSPEQRASFIENDPQTAERIRAYLGGEEMNDSPEATHCRYTIYMEGLNESEVQRWTSLYQHLHSTVRLQRVDSAEERLRECWWLYSRPAKELYQACKGMSRVLAGGRAGAHVCFAFQPPDTIFSDSLTLFLFDKFVGFAVLQGRAHEVWARFFGSSLKDDPRYIPEDCFETFPFPSGFETSAELEATGREYYEFRAALMQDLWLGLTEIYNLFHSPDDEALARLEALYRKRTGRAPSDWHTVEKVPADRLPLTLYVTPAAALAGVRRLRELHAAMDAAVLTSYGWTDLLPKCNCEFLLDYEDEESESGAEESGGRRKKKPWRYRWPDEIRDEVLARLLKLNAERAKEEELAGQIAAQKTKPKKATKKAVVPKEQIGLPLQPRAIPPRKHSHGINFKRGAIASYAVNRLCDRWEFGRVQMEKVFYGAQCIIGIDLEMDFKPYENGPFDEEIHKIESLAKKERWFDSVPRQSGIGTEYRRGANIVDRCGAAKSILADKLADFDRILDWMGKMDSEQAGIWTTVHFVWNNLILSRKPISDEAIVKGFYRFHEAKKSIEEHRVRTCIKWMQDEGFVPQGITFIAPKLEDEEPELPTDFRLPASQPLLYTTNLVLTLLSKAGGSLAWPRLLDAYVLATNPKLMQRMAPPKLAAQSKAWAARWNETVPDGLLLPSLDQLGSRNLTVTESSEGLVLHLLDGPRPPATDDVAYDAWIALRIATTLTPDAVQVSERPKWTEEVEKLALA